MTANGWIQIAGFVAAVLLVTKPLGIFLQRVFERERTWLDPVLRPVERLIYSGLRSGRDQRDALDGVRRGDADVQRGLASGFVLSLNGFSNGCRSIPSISGM